MFRELSTGVREQAHTFGVLGSTSEKAEEIVQGFVCVCGGGRGGVRALSLRIKGA